VLLAPMFWGIELLLAERIFANRKKASLFPFSVLLLAGGFSALPVTASWPFSHGFGGLVGDWLCKVAASLFALFGAGDAYGVSGLIFFLGGFAALGYSVGLEREDLTRLLQRNGGMSFQRATFLPGWLQRMWGPDVAYAGADEPHAGSFDTEPEFGGQDEPYLPDPSPREPAFGNEPVRAASPFSDAEVAEPLEGLSAGRVAKSWTPDATAMVDGDTAGFDLDPNSDISSRAIAERFAPESACRRSKPSRTSPEEEQSAPAKMRGDKGGLFGGLRIARPSGYRAPPLNLLKRPQGSQSRPGITQNVLRGTARLLEEVLADFSIKGEVRDIKPGPVVTLYELEPARGTKSSRVVGLADDIARSMSVISARAAVVPGRNVIGIELPNVRRETVYLREILESDAFRSSTAVLPLALGKSIGGSPVVADLARMPHLLVAGTTGSGKSVGINAMVL